MLYIVGSSHGRVKPKTIKLVFAASLLSMQHGGGVGSYNDRQDFQLLSLVTSSVGHQNSPIIYSRSQFVDTENITNQNQRKHAQNITH